MDVTHEECRPAIVTSGEESVQALMASQQPPVLPEIRLVLLGRKGAGKSAAVNTILGGGAGGFESGKPTEECVKRRADVAGRRVTVVDTPGWEWYYPLNRTANWVRRETLRSVSLCSSGPHAVLLVVRSCASVTEDYIREIEEHLEPLGGGVWEHIMLLFTRGDELGLASMEQRIQASGPALQRLLRKCGNRYHVVDNRSKGDGTQVKELMRKLEEMVEGKKGGCGHLEMDNTVLVGLEADGKRRARERRKKQRQMEAQMQRGTIRAALMSDGLQGSELDAHQSFSKAPRRLTEVRLLLLGERETGKSSAANSILGRSSFFQAGEVTEECTHQQAEVAMRVVTVVDTPGWEGGVAGATPERVKREIVSSVALCPPGPHALLLTLRVDTLVRVTHVREHLELLGEGVWRHTILLFTHGDQLREGVDIEQHIQGGGRDLQWMLEKCRGRYHVISCDNGESNVMELLQKVEKMAAMNKCEAFSGLVQEVRDLSRQRNEKFNQRLKEIGDKMLHQEDELKNMREREMKRIRWFFDRKKKVKSPGKADVQREEEEEEDRRMEERKHDIGEIEERMRWLTEDKERETQDLSIENKRIHAALKQSQKERDEAALKLELKEREVEELKERIDEQQLKLLDLERVGVENEQERKQREDSIKAKTQEWMSELKKLEENAALQEKEKAELMERVESLKAEMDETKRHHGGILERKEQDKHREMTRMEEKLREEMREQEERRRKAVDKIEQYERKAAQHVLHQDEMRRKIKELETQHQEELDEKLKACAEAVERVQQQHVREIKELKEQLAKEREDKDREVRELERRFLRETEERRVEGEKEKEMIHLDLRKNTTKKMQEKESEMEALKQQHGEEMRRRVEEMEEVMEARRAERQEEAERREREAEEVKRRIAEERQERRREIQEMEQKYAVQREEKMLENEKEKKVMSENHKKHIVEKMKEKDGLIEELKRQYGQESKKKEQEHKRIVLDLKTEAEEMKKSLTDMKEKLRQKEERESFYLKDKKDMERTMEEREREIKEVLHQTEEERHSLKTEKEGTIEKLKQEVKAGLRREEEMTVRAKKEEELRRREVEEVKKELKEKESEAERREKRWRDERRKGEDELKRMSKIVDDSLETERRKDAEMMEKEEEVREKEREIVQLRLTIEQTRAELKELAARMEKETTSMIRGYEKEIARRSESMEGVVKEREEVAKRCEELREEMDNLRMKCEEAKKESEEEANKLRAEMERMKEGAGEAERKRREGLQKLAKREKEVEQREQILSKRGRDVDAREGELVGKEVRLERLDDELRKREASLEKRQKEQEDKEKREQARARDTERKERELESLLGALEGKQEELKRHGQVLQQRVKGLKELQDRECHLRSEERGLLSWKSELQVQNEHVSVAAQQLDDVRRDMALLKEELHGKERKLAEREQRVKEREEGLDTREGAGSDLMYSEVSERREEERQDERTNRASSAAESGNCHLETLKEIEEGERGRGGEESKMKGREALESAKVVQDVTFLSASRAHGTELPASDLRVLVLGESWSPRSPAGVSILSGEASKPDGSTSFRPWRGQVAGRRLAVAEPLGLKWRDGPGRIDGVQRSVIADSVAWCRPGPDAVLLLVPAFLTCTQKYRRAAEEHVALLGEDVWRRTVVLFTWGETLGESAEQHILRNGELTGLVGRCGGRYHVLSSRNRNCLLEKIEAMLDLNRSYECVIE